jgi:hypothetical protein
MQVVPIQQEKSKHVYSIPFIYSNPNLPQPMISKDNLLELKITWGDILI